MKLRTKQNIAIWNLEFLHLNKVEMLLTRGGHTFCMACIKSVPPPHSGPKLEKMCNICKIQQYVSLLLPVSDFVSPIHYMKYLKIEIEK